MLKQLLFIISLIITLGIFTYSVLRLLSFFKLTKKGFPVRNLGKRFGLMMKVAIGQTKMFRRPILGFIHALVFWGFCVILIGSIEMVIDGVFGTERVLKVLGVVYDVIIASGDIFALIIALAIILFLFRRIFLHVKRFSGIEMTHKTHRDANFALTLILLLMVSLLGMNTFYYQHAVSSGHEIYGVYPVSKFLAGWFAGMPESQLFVFHEMNWWAHILLIFFFANYLPYSKHFHVFLSVPNVFLSRLEPLGKLDNMESITREVQLMMDPDAAFQEPADNGQEENLRFGVKDIEDVLWKNYFDSLACTQCGRCTAVCPANITGKKLSPRKIIMDVRSRMNEKGPKMVKEHNFDDGKSLLRDFITEEELWACTTCNACAQECPININHPTLIVEMRRYLVMEEAASPGELNTIFNNIENNGAPWQFSQEDRMLWAEELYINEN
jgi:heterodisulfide reductase subunit C/nitrate reductase gamma subunit